MVTVNSKAILRLVRAISSRSSKVMPSLIIHKVISSKAVANRITRKVIRSRRTLVTPSRNLMQRRAISSLRTPVTLSLGCLRRSRVMLSLTSRMVMARSLPSLISNHLCLGIISSPFQPTNGMVKQLPVSCCRSSVC